MNINYITFIIDYYTSILALIEQNCLPDTETLMLWLICSDSYPFKEHLYRPSSWEVIRVKVRYEMSSSLVSVCVIFIFSLFLIWSHLIAVSSLHQVTLIGSPQCLTGQLTVTLCCGTVLYVAPLWTITAHEEMSKKTYKKYQISSKTHF